MSFPSQHRYSHDDTGEPDPERNQLIPARKRNHRVRVQGRLAVVRSVSTVNLRPAASALPSPVGANTSGTTTAPAAPKFESGVAGSTVPPARRRKSLDDGGGHVDAEGEHDVEATAVRDRQFRGYGIGGAGNIRRPTEMLIGGGHPNHHSAALRPLMLDCYSTNCQVEDSTPEYYVFVHSEFVRLIVPRARNDAIDSIECHQGRCRLTSLTGCQRPRHSARKTSTQAGLTARHEMYSGDSTRLAAQSHAARPIHDNSESSLTQAWLPSIRSFFGTRRPLRDVKPDPIARQGRPSLLNLATGIHD
ncbi:hypothetical protein Cob_v012427 [Colletotrichum orbiculare MAFF 240422]|uniref:Uncharacterized protein n=1 Tax=Colletotrichum orbiculare (strain 104-T / ATCC 96160 / CBS 514.97 / LARS 414 / MAFF 240422) TaxID=1213857 RepID=A0A484FAW7_COLOR|nr:hypothetical protein Cob_v012427 [Colletotrichum orbiculare MAFF 240422]